MTPYKLRRTEVNFNPRIWGLGLSVWYTDHSGYGVGIVFGPFEISVTSRTR